MDYCRLVEVYEDLGSTTKRLKKVDILSAFLKKVNKNELKEVVYLIQGRVYPEWSEEKTGMSSRLMLKSISVVTGVSPKEIEKLWNKMGDLGKVAEKLISKKRQATLHRRDLTVKKVFENIRKLSSLTGEGTVNRKVQLVAELLSNAEPVEARYIVRTVLEELRIGIAEGIVNDSIAKAYDIDVKDVKKSFDLLVDYGEVALHSREGRVKATRLGVGRPLKLMLAIKVKDANEAFEAMGKPAQAEYKLDGFRLQIHKSKDIKLFTRRMENVTKQFPDVVDFVEHHVKGKSFIIDCEAVGYDKKTGKYLPFQTVSQRIKRKYDIASMAKKYPVELNVFDVVYYNGKSLMREPLKSRRKLLEKIVKPEKRKIVLTKKLVSSDGKAIMEFFKEALKHGLEGLMIKNLGSDYKPGRYVGGWVKLKSTMEPLDLVITKAQWGEGKRAKWLSSFTLACKKGSEFLEIGKVGTGVKEKAEGVTFAELTKLLKPLITKEKGKIVYLKPKVVVEVMYEEIQKSPTYSSGYALRFPRFVMIREEKGVSEINTLHDVERLYKQQKKT